MTAGTDPAVANVYDLDSIAELYDRLETQTADLAFIQRLIADQPPLRILEPFAGTGRILIPLAVDGHRVTGLELAPAMLRRTAAKVASLPQAIQDRITLCSMNVLREPWPAGFDLVILAGNCLYELATPPEQEWVIRAAVAAARSGGYLYVDNDHMEGPLAPSWCELGEKPAFPSGRCADGTELQSTLETIWFDRDSRLARFRRRVQICAPDGRVSEHIFVQQKHPVSAAEVCGWLEVQGVKVEGCFGDHHGRPHTQDSERAIFWARKP